MSEPSEASNSICEKSGFQVGTETHFRWLNGIVKAVLVMNLIDAVLTLLWVRTGFATEANPLLSQIVEQHAFLFVMGKLALVFLGTGMLWRHRHRPLAVMGIFAAFMVYYAVLVYHLSFASILLRQLI